MMAMHLPLWKTPLLPARSEGLLAGEKPFYRTYACADGKFVAVGALERAFFEALWHTLGLGKTPDHMSVSSWPMIESKLTAAFAARPRDEWAALFAGTDACVTPVLEPDEIWSEAHIAARHPRGAPESVPAVPRFSRTPAREHPLDLTDRTAEILKEHGLDPGEIDTAMPRASDPGSSGLSWPPTLAP
jgi:alpha-methylacyl-CoA racemase